MAGTAGAAVRASGRCCRGGCRPGCSWCGAGSWCCRADPAGTVDNCCFCTCSTCSATQFPERQASSWPKIHYLRLHRSAGASCYHVGCFKAAGKTRRIYARDMGVLPGVGTAVGVTVGAGISTGVAGMVVTASEASSHTLILVIVTQ